MNFPPYGNQYYKENLIEAVLKAKPQNNPNMTLYVSPGGGWLNGKIYIEYSGGNSGTFTTPASGAKWSLLVLNNSGFLEIQDGEASDNPTFPGFPRNRIVICAVYIQSDTTRLTYENVFDFRPFVSNPIRSHIDLDNKSESDAHPIDSITNLRTELDNRIDTTSFNSALENKADQDGTDETTFTMNKDQSGTPSSNVTFEVERGDLSNVAVRFNETDDVWEYTMNGTDFYRLDNAYFEAANDDDWESPGPPTTIWGALDELASRISALES